MSVRLYCECCCWLGGLRSGAAQYSCAAGVRWEAGSSRSIRVIRDVCAGSVTSLACGYYRERAIKM